MKAWGGLGDVVEFIHTNIYLIDQRLRGHQQYGFDLFKESGVNNWKD